MIESISLQNYKAFSNVTIPLRPLTILLGANCVGKSSILQMLILLHQTVEERGYKYSSPLKIYGNYVNLGAFENLYKGKVTKDPLCIEIDLESKSLLEQIRRMKKDYIRDFKMLCKLYPLKNLWELASLEITSKNKFESFVKDVLKNINKPGVKSLKKMLYLCSDDELVLPKSK